jgi:hypothetical protein
VPNASPGTIPRTDVTEVAPYLAAHVTVGLRTLRDKSGASSGRLLRKHQSGKAT